MSRVEDVKEEFARCWHGRPDSNFENDLDALERAIREDEFSNLIDTIYVVLNDGGEDGLREWLQEHLTW